jgi:hypothetical protein
VPGRSVVSVVVIISERSAIVPRASSRVHEPESLNPSTTPRRDAAGRQRIVFSIRTVVVVDIFVVWFVCV